ncbi:sigma-70 family RNA polymerase sigma factor [Planctomycetota bacterium]|nr:sigma-70 family RNA polymerase sigma factor [Planctomycetota bacterium]
MDILDPNELISLVKEARQGNRNAFHRLVTYHQRVAGGVAYGILGDIHLSADAVQEAFVKAWQSISMLKEDERFSAWFLSIVRSKALDLLRQRKRKAPEYAQVDSERDVSPDLGPLEKLESSEKAQRIRKLIEDLPPEYREILLLKHQLDKSYLEIARILGSTPKAVESKLARARKLLAERWNLQEDNSKRGGGNA